MSIPSALRCEHGSLHLDAQPLPAPTNKDVVGRFGGFCHGGSPLLARVDDEMLRYSDGEVADDDVCDFVNRYYCDLVDVLLLCAKNLSQNGIKVFTSSGGRKT